MYRSVSKRPRSLWALFVLLSGCATLSPEECLQANWEEVGYNDAAEGYAMSRSAEHREACADTGVSVDFELYRNGYSLGLPYYCTRETAFETADHGGAFATQCTRETFPDYALGYSEGREVYALKSQRSELQAAIDDKAAQSDALLSQIAALRETRDDPEATKDTRQQARYQQTQLEALYRALYDEIEQLEDERDDISVAIDSRIAAFYGSL